MRAAINHAQKPATTKNKTHGPTKRHNGERKRGERTQAERRCKGTTRKDAKTIADNKDSTEDKQQRAGARRALGGKETRRKSAKTTRAERWKQEGHNHAKTQTRQPNANAQKRQTAVNGCTPNTGRQMKQRKDANTTTESSNGRGPNCQTCEESNDKGSIRNAQGQVNKHANVGETKHKGEGRLRYSKNETMPTDTIGFKSKQADRMARETRRMGWARCAGRKARSRGNAAEAQIENPSPNATIMDTCNAAPCL